VQVSYLLSEINNTAQKILELFPENKIFLLKGPLGAGKTRLVKSFMEILGDAVEVTSPTYSLIQEYSGHTGLIVHLDLYRAKNPKEIFDLGVFEYLEKAEYAFIEWPEQIEPYMEGTYLNLNFKVIDTISRELSLIQIKG
jgi:tRNA threonylcarbamoyladenosine biosynthesis protein TsaE